MLILLKQSKKTSLLVLLFITAGTYLYALTPSCLKSENKIEQNLVSLSNFEGSNEVDMNYFTADDSIQTMKTDTGRMAFTPRRNVPLPGTLAIGPINFQINSYIYYLSLNHFVDAEAKRLFLQGLLKEKELNNLSLHTDSLRKAYSSASFEEREKISSLIMEAEQKSIALNEEIPAIFQKIREGEDSYWQNASMDEISKFQQSVQLYEDSITKNRKVVAQAEVHDTITLYTSAPEVEEKKAEIPGGVVYKIQIGAYKGKIPDSANKLIKKLSIIRKVENHVDDKGFKTYTTGNLRLYSEAVTMLSQVKQEGVKTAVITAYQNGKKIPVPEAKKLNNEL